MYSSVNIFAAIIISLLTILSLNAQISPLDGLSRLEGDWSNIDGNEIGEKWSLKKGSLEGYGYKIKEKDTIAFEKLSIIQEHGEIYYVADVEHNPGPVRFKLMHWSDQVYIFNNPEHDFPNEIKYEFINNDRLEVKVSGAENSFTVSFIKVQ